MAKLRMLIGDDCFTQNRIAEAHLLGMFVEMKRELGIGGKLVDEGIENGWYKTNDLIIPGFSGVDIRVLDNEEGMIREGNEGTWDWVISDLDYGHGRETGGLRVMRYIPAKSGVIRAIFTSGDDAIKLQRQKAEAGIDYFIAPSISTNPEDAGLLKADLLGRTIARHYKNHTNVAEAGK